MRIDLVACAIALLATPAARGQEAAPAPEEGSRAAEEWAADAREPTEEGEARPDREGSEAEGSPRGEFVFGSYGRAQIYFDRDGNPGRDVNVVAHGPRLAEPSYAELDFQYRLRAADGFDARVLATLALFEPWAHYDGAFGDEGWAVRNLLAEAGGFVPGLEELRLWAGSRMYRGDDIYLLDFWPLDDLNTIGGGAILERAGFDLRLHAGVNRLDDDYQLQTVAVPGAQHGAEEILLLDRQRTVFSARLGYTFSDIVGELDAELLLWGEGHRLPAGRRVPEELLDDDGSSTYPLDQVAERLPADGGFAIGAQLGLFDFAPAAHVNLFVRYARDLVAYGELGVPYGTDDRGTSDGAQELVVALDACWQNRWVGAMLGAYLRRFVDADVNRYDTDDFAEGALVARPVVFLSDHFHQGFEISYQQHRPFGLDPRSNDQEIAEVWQLTVMEILGLDRGCYQRPQLRFYYTLSLPNSSARDVWRPEDRRRPDRVEHLFGLGAEWWFNSSTYR